MSSYTNRLSKLESTPTPATKIVYRFSSFVSYDDEGHTAKVVVYGAANRTLLGSFPAQPGESTEAKCVRAYAAVGYQSDMDGVIERHMVHADPNGGFAPGFERFAKRA